MTAPLYVFDTNSLSVFGNYYPTNFPSFWTEFDGLASSGGAHSCWEVRKELERLNRFEHLNDWADNHMKVFPKPTGSEMAFVAEIFKIEHFRQLIGKRQQLIGTPVADPFVVARGAILGACIVTEERLKPNAAKIPNVCQHFSVAYTDVEGFLNAMGWRF